MIWPKFISCPLNLFNFPPWKYEMYTQQIEELKEFFKLDQEMFEETKKELLKQIHLQTVIYDYETQIFIKQLVEDGYICLPHPCDDVTLPFLSTKGLKEIGL